MRASARRGPDPLGSLWWLGDGVSSHNLSLIGTAASCHGKKWMGVAPPHAGSFVVEAGMEGPLRPLRLGHGIVPTVTGIYFFPIQEGCPTVPTCWDGGEEVLGLERGTVSDVAKQHKIAAVHPCQSSCGLLVSPQGMPHPTWDVEYSMTLTMILPMILTMILLLDPICRAAAINASRREPFPISPMPSSEEGIARHRIRFA
jgi:hypothetical protein